MKKINCTIILFLCCFLSQTASVYAMKRLNCKSPNQILTENLQNIQVEWLMPIALIRHLTIISYVPLCLIINNDDKAETNKYIGSDNKRFACTECPKTFYQNSNLTLHMRTHTRTKPYKCKFCKNRFTQKIHLIKHMKIHPKQPKTDNLTPLFNDTCNTCNHDDVDDEYFLEWINQ